MSKIRHGFVTNSSSSSFIIGKKEEKDVTIESVYQFIKSFYSDMLKARDEMIAYVNDNPTLGVEYAESEYSKGWYKFKFKSGKAWDKANDVVDKMLKKTFGISTWEDFGSNEYYEWLKCETYSDYEQYWMNKIENKQYGKYTHAPFTVIDFLDVKPVKWLHCGGFCEQENYTTIDSSSDILLWYYEQADRAFENLNDCEKCSERKWCDEYKDSKDECLKTKKLIKDTNIPEDHACLYMLGRVCIESECGYIPDYVVDKLREFSTFSCNHMG